MKKSESQLNTCDSCGRRITGESHSISTKHGSKMIFHKETMDCAKAPTVREIRTREEDR
jgi:hypothetical protein